MQAPYAGDGLGGARGGATAGRQDASPPCTGRSSAEGGTAASSKHRQARADALIAVSDHVARDAVARLPALAGKLETISPGINLDRFDPAAVRADRLIRLAAELRVPDGRHVDPLRPLARIAAETLIEAIKRLGRDDVFCLLLGPTEQSTPFEKELERTIGQAGPAAAACSSAPMSRTCRRPTCWPMWWWRPAARAKASAAR